MVRDTERVVNGKQVEENSSLIHIITHPNFRFFFLIDRKGDRFIRKKEETRENVRPTSTSTSNHLDQTIFLSTNNSCTSYILPRSSSSSGIINF